MTCTCQSEISVLQLCALYHSKGSSLAAFGRQTGLWDLCTWLVNYVSTYCKPAFLLMAQQHICNIDCNDRNHGPGRV